MTGVGDQLHLQCNHQYVIWALFQLGFKGSKFHPEHVMKAKSVRTCKELPVLVLRFAIPVVL